MPSLDPLISHLCFWMNLPIDVILAGVISSAIIYLAPNSIVILRMLGNAYELGEENVEKPMTVKYMYLAGRLLND